MVILIFICRENFIENLYIEDQHIDKVDLLYLIKLISPSLHLLSR
jgi:hypothetical protein